MCLLHTHHPDTVLKREDIADYFSYNGDGVGVMYSEPDENGVPRLIVKKALPKTVEEAWQFYEQNIKGREALVHWRWATHGHVDLLNCHPYPIVGMEEERPLFMMHNGILSIGNAADPSKSDTWHFIEEYLKPLFDPQVGGDVGLVFREPFIHLLTKTAGSSNKLAFMDSEGNIALTAKDDWHEENGILYSNTYAWTPADSWGNRRYQGAFGNEDGFDHWDRHYNKSTKKFETRLATTQNFATVTELRPKDALGNTIVGTRSTSGSSSANENYTMTIKERATLDEYRPAFDDMFVELDEAKRKLSYRELRYIDMVWFVQEVGLAALWALTTKVTTRTMLQKDYVNYVKHPAVFKAWADADTITKVEQMRATEIANEMDRADGYDDDEPEVFDVDAIVGGDEVHASATVPGEVYHYRMIGGTWHRRVGQSTWVPTPEYNPDHDGGRVWTQTEEMAERADADADWLRSAPGIPTHMGE